MSTLPVLASLHWLPFSLRMGFSILLIIFKAFHGLTPGYISDLLFPYEPVHTLRSSGRGVLSIPESRLTTRGDVAFTVKGLRLWNDLPDEVRLSKSVSSFKLRLKSYFYRRAYPDLV